MKRISFLLVLILSLINVHAQVKNQPRLHNWIATFMPEANSATLRHVIVMADGTLRSWKPGEPPTAYLDIYNVVQVSAGGNHLLMLKKDGTIWSIGENDDFELGNKELNDNKVRRSEEPIQVSDITSAIAISTRYNTSYALLQDGTVWAWGDRASGRIGDGGDMYGETAPVQVKGLRNVIAISGAMALLSDGTIWTWGDGSGGRLGSTVIRTNIPVKISGVTNAVAITNFEKTNVALLADGTITTWGYNYKGQLGNGIKTSEIWREQNMKSLVPVKVVGITNAIAIDAESSCLALLKDGTVKGWGWGELSALGPLGGDATPTPVKVFDLKNVVAVKAGNGSGFALLKDGSLLGWGSAMVSSGPYRLSRKVIKIASFGSLAPKAGN